MCTEPGVSRQVRNKDGGFSRRGYFGTKRKDAAKREKLQIYKTSTVCAPPSPYWMIVQEMGVSKAQKIKTHKISVGSTSR
jgi:hypothetical protein